MSSPSTQFSISRRMGIYDPFYQIGMWDDDTFNGHSRPNSVVSTMVMVDSTIRSKAENTSHESLGVSGHDQGLNTLSDKSRRRLAQNREAARRSRLRKKTYVQQLETSRLKLAQLEQQLEQARQRDVYIRSGLDSTPINSRGAVNSGVSTFQIEYAKWVEEQQGQNHKLRNALQTHTSDVELRILVENGLSHYNNLFVMKEVAAKEDIFYLISGMWRTSVERFFLWIGGFRPSELLHVLMPKLEPLTEQQLLSVRSLRHLSQQAEDALSQGMDKLQQTLSDNIITGSLDEETYRSQMAVAFENLEELEGFVNQADHLRQQTLQQMYRILTIRQAARGLLVLGEYFHRLRSLSSLWAARPREANQCAKNL